MIRSKYLPSLTVVAVFGALGCYSTTVSAEDVPGDKSLSQGAPSSAEDAGEAQPPSPRSPLRVNSFDYEDAGEDAGKLTIAGIALPGNELFLYFDDQPLARVVPDAGGNWSVESDLKLDDGRHMLRAEQYDPETRMLAARAMITIAKQPQGGTPKAP